MEKHEFYNTHLKNNDYYRMSVGLADQALFEDKFAGMYSRAGAILRCSSKEGMEPCMYGPVSFQAANRILRTYADGMEDGKKMEWTLLADWKSSSVGMTDRWFIQKLSVSRADAQNDHIIESYMLDEYIRKYDKKVADPAYPSFSLDCMMLMPEMHAQLMEESRLYMDSRDKKSQEAELVREVLLDMDMAEISKARNCPVNGR